MTDSNSWRWLQRAALVACAWTSLGISACSDKGDDSAPQTCDREPALDWDNFGQGFMNRHCTGCHSVLYPEYLRSGAPLTVNFNTYYDVLTFVERIEVRAAVDEPDMPPSGGPTDDELALLREWLECAVWPDHDELVERGEL